MGHLYQPDSGRIALELSSEEIDGQYCLFRTLRETLDLALER